MRLYVANCTRQEHILTFTLPETKGYRQMPVPALGQNATADLNQPQVDDIIRQLEQFGLTALKDIDRTRGKMPLVFDIDKVISPKVIQRVYDHNVLALREEGGERRKRAAVADSNAVDNAVTNAAQQARVGDHRPFLPRRFETTVEEVDQGSFTEQEPMGEGVRVNKSGEPAPRGRRRAA